MEEVEAKKRIGKLREAINKYRYEYHVLDKQTISDAALDSLKRELTELERQFPRFITPDSPTQRVAGKPLKVFKKIRHAVRQWSFDDAFSEEDMRDFDAKVKRQLENRLNRKIAQISYTAELKIDGFKIVLTYKKGLLISAATRGNGEIGEDVTENVKTIEAVPLRLTRPVSLVAEGEVWMSRKELERLNRERKKSGEPLFANLRNVAAGSIRQLNPAVARSRQLDNFIYDLPFLKGEKIPETQYAELEFLKKLGFKVNQYAKECQNIDEVLAFWRYWESRRDKEPYLIDGVAVKVNRVDYQKTLGYTGKSPRFGVALKFSAEEATTVVNDITVQVGRTGALTPVAHLTPVKVAGTTVSRATLHNADEIERLDLQIGDSVIIQKAGDVIPDVVSVIKELRTGKEKKFAIPRVCPVCEEKTEQEAGGPIMRCVNHNCPSRTRRGLYYFVSKPALNIPGLGPKIIDALADNGLINDAADIFDLTEGDISPIERFAEKSAENLIASIKSRREVSFARFIVSLGILHVGAETAETLAKSFGDIKDLEKANLEELMAIKDVGGVVAESIHAWFRESKNKRFLEKLLARIKIIYPKISKTAGRLSGKIFVLTGAMEKMSRDEAKAKIKALGGEISESVSKRTDYVAVGENPGSKYDKARELGVKILNEKEFLTLVK